MDINVTVSDVTLDTVMHAYGESEKTIGDEVTRQLVRRITDDRDSYSNLRARVTEIRDEEIRKHVVPLIEEALTGPVQEYRFGEPVGQPTTWWRPKARREHDGTLMAGWLRFAVAARFDRAARALTDGTR